MQRTLNTWPTEHVQHVKSFMENAVSVPAWSQVLALLSGTCHHLPGGRGLQM